MKKSILIILSLVVFLFVAASFCSADGLLSDTTGNVNLLVGKKFVRDDVIRSLSVDILNEGGIEIDVKKDKWLLSPVVGALYAQDRNRADYYGVSTDFDLHTTELYLGLKYIDEHFGNWRPYIGGGVVYAEGEMDVTVEGQDFSVKERGFGPWFGAGVYYTVSDRINIGFNIRYSDVEIGTEYINNDVQLGGTHCSLLVGYHF